MVLIQSGVSELICYCCRNPWKHVYDLQTAFCGECDDAFSDCIKGVVSSDAYAFARMEFASTLSDDDVAWNDIFVAVGLDTETLRITVASVSG